MLRYRRLPCSSIKCNLVFYESCLPGVGTPSSNCEQSRNYLLSHTIPGIEGLFKAMQRKTVIKRTVQRWGITVADLGYPTSKVLFFGFKRYVSEKTNINFDI